MSSLSRPCIEEGGRVTSGLGESALCEVPRRSHRHGTILLPTGLLVPAGASLAHLAAPLLLLVFRAIEWADETEGASKYCSGVRSVSEAEMGKRRALSRLVDFLFWVMSGPGRLVASCLSLVCQRQLS